MINRRAPAADSPAAQRARRLDRLCDRFEAAWKAGRRPSLERYLGKVPQAAQPELLRELLRLELEYRGQRGEKPQRDDYRLRFPDQAALIDTVFAEAVPSVRSTPSLVRRWTVNRLANELHMLLFPAERQAGPSAEGEAASVGASLFARLLGAISAGTAGAGASGLYKAVANSTHQPQNGLEPRAAAYSDPSRPTKPLQNGIVRIERDSGTDNRAGTTLGDYELLEKLGKGGMGIVYRARQRSVNRIVALKIIRPDRLEELTAEECQEWFERFRREGRIAAGVEHEHLVTVYEVGQAGGQLFYSMRFVEGQSLADILRNGPLPNQCAALYMEEVAQALHVLHLHGTVHRDVKPRNILIDKQDRPFVTDYGLAKSSIFTQGLTRTGACMGTPEYMAPEQARNSAAAGPASDIYSLGATLYELLTGRPPFRAADPVETLRQVREEEPLSPRRLNPAVHCDLESICLKCLQKEPHKRYTSALELAEELHRYRTGQPLQHTRPVTKVERVWLWCRRKPLQAAVTGLVAIVLLSFTALSVGTAFVVQLREEQHRTRSARQEADRLSIRLALEGGISLCQQGEIARGLFEWAKSLAIAPGENPDLKHAVRANLAAWSREISPPKAFLPHPADVVAASFSPDGKMLMIVSGSIDERETRWIPFTPFPRDGQMPYYFGKQFQNGSGTSGRRNGEISLWDVATGKPIGKPLPHDDVIEVAVFSPDGKTILSGSRDGAARLWDVATGKLVAAPFCHEGTVIAVAFDIDGKTLLTAAVITEMPLPEMAACATCLLASPAGPAQYLASSILIPGRTVARRTAPRLVEIRLWDAATGKCRSSFSITHEGFLSACFIPEGHRLLTRSFLTAQLWDLKTRKAVCRPIKHQAAITCLAFGPGGKTFVTGSADGVTRLWDAFTGHEIRQFAGHQGMITAVALNGDGTILVTASTDRTARLYDVATGRMQQKFQGHLATVCAAVLSHDGRLIVTGSLDKTVRLWDATTGRQFGAPLAHAGDIRILAFSPENETVLSCSSDNITRLWSTAAASHRITAFKHRLPVQIVEFSHNGRIVMTASCGDTLSSSELCLWDVTTKSLFRPPQVDTGAILQASFSPNDKYLVSRSSDKKARLWDITSGRINVFHHDGPLFAVCFMPDGSAVLTGSADGTARLWNVSTTDLRFEFRQQDKITAACLSHDGRFLITGSNQGKVRLWDMGTRKLIRELPGSIGRIYCVAFSPDGRLAAAGSWDNAACLWDVETGELVGSRLQHRGPVTILVFSPADAKTLLTASYDGTAALWQFATGRRLANLLLHQGRVNDAAFSPDGRMVATASADATTRLWDVATGEPVGPYLLHPDQVRSIAFSPDGKSLVTGCDDREARIWQVPAPLETDAERIMVWTEAITGMSLGENRAPRQLSAEEWHQRSRQLEEWGHPPLP